MSERTPPGFAGIPEPAGLAGRSLLWLVNGAGDPGRNDFVTGQYHSVYSVTGTFMIRQGDYKLIERFEDGRAHLFNLATDLGEKEDLAERQPDKVLTMRKDLHEWYRKVDAKFLRQKPGGPRPWQP